MSCSSLRAGVAPATTRPTLRRRHTGEGARKRSTHSLNCPSTTTGTRYVTLHNQSHREAVWNTPEDMSQEDERHGGLRERPVEAKNGARGQRGAARAIGHRVVGGERVLRTGRAENKGTSTHLHRGPLLVGNELHSRRRACRHGQYAPPWRFVVITVAQSPLDANVQRLNMPKSRGDRDRRAVRTGQSWHERCRLVWKRGC